MALGKQAKIVTKSQIDAVLGYLSSTRHPERNKAIFLLSIKAGLRAKEIACLKWQMLTDPNGEIIDNINLTNDASKGRRGGRIIPINRELKATLNDLRKSSKRQGDGIYVVTTERSSATHPQVIVNLFSSWYSRLGLMGCSSHSGRRTFITNAARKISTVGGSLRDIQMLAGHSNLSTTQRYIEADVEAQRKIVEII